MPPPADKPTPEEGGSKTHRRTRTAEIADATGDAAIKFARLSPQQLLSLFAIAALAFICSLQAFQVYSEREERKSIARERQDGNAAMIRESNAQSELVRYHCSTESRELRTFFAEQNDKRMKFESDERAKDRAVLMSLALRLEGIEKLLKKD